MNCTQKVAATGLALLSLAATSSSLLAAEKAILADRAAANQKVGFEVYIPVQHRAELDRDLEAMQDAGSKSFHQWLTPAQVEARYGATPGQVAAIRAQLTGYGLESTQVSGHHLHVTGSAGNIEQALGTVLKNGTFKSNGRKIVAAIQPLTPPAALTAVNAAVLGLEDGVRVKMHSHIVVGPNNRVSATGGYWFTDLKQAYAFPSYQSFTGAGVTVATLMTGAYNQNDMNLYFHHEGLATPNFSEINVDGGAPFDNDSIETNLDFQQAGGMAPGATLIHYNIPDLSDQSIVDGLDQIVVDNKADVVSMSFGGPELLYSKEYQGENLNFILKLEDDLFAEGNLEGITFIASSGDTGALTVPPLACFVSYPSPPNCGTMRASAEFPASSPHVTGVGGTNLVTSYDGTLNSTYVSEEAYGDPLTVDLDFGTTSSSNYWGSGGGNSMVFAKPTFQILANTGSTKWRTVPDVAGHMGGCPGGSVQPCNPDDSYVYVAFNGYRYGVIGTSASAPDFAGLTALALQHFGSRLGNENSYIYTLALAQSLGVGGKVFNQGISGFNGLYSGTKTGYNRVLGNGTVNGANFLMSPATPLAGTPGSASNP